MIKKGKKFFIAVILLAAAFIYEGLVVKIVLS